MARHQEEAAPRLRAYFAERLTQYGDDPRGVDWQSAEAQEARFSALGTLWPLQQASILDAGCGLGHFYAYLRAHGFAGEYTGCDLSAPHLAVAVARYPEARFLCADVAELVRAECFDYVLACGLLHLRVPHWQRWAWRLVEGMYRSCRIGLGFTLPRQGAGHPPVLATVVANDWRVRLQQLSPAVVVHELEPWGDLLFQVSRCDETPQPSS